MGLDESREAIRAIDEQIAGLFVERMEAARDIAAYKQERGLPVEDAQQEARVLADRGALVEDEELRPFYLEFLQHTMDVSKSWQLHLMRGGAEASAGGHEHDDAKANAGGHERDDAKASVSEQERNDTPGGLSA